MFGMICLFVLGIILIMFGIAVIGIVMQGNVFKHEKIWGTIAFFSCIGGLVLALYEIFRVIQLIFH